jgi:hypothetical protein
LLKKYPVQAPTFLETLNGQKRFQSPIRESPATGFPVIRKILSSSVRITLAGAPDEGHLLAEVPAAVAKKKVYSQAYPFYQTQAAVQGVRYQH